MNFLASRAVQEVGVYWHMLPSAAQARKVIWNGIDGNGRRIIDQAFPPEIVTQRREDEMMLRLFNGSVIQLVGSDNYDSLVGAGTKGVVFSEYAIADPRSWDYIRPMLMENGGWAIFISTPRGRNHFHKLHTGAPESWFTERLTVNDTFREDGVTRIFTAENVEEERNSGMAEEMIQQEYFSSWEGGLEGSFYMQEMNNLRDNRFGHHPHAPYSNAISVWDLGVRDATAIGIFHSMPDGAPLLTDTIIDRNKGLDTYIRHLRNTPYSFHYHFAPHDIEQREYTTGKSRRELAERMGISFDVTPNISREDGINQTRAFLNNLWVNDTPSNRIVLDHLSAYRREFDPKRNVYKDTPLHDYTADVADMIRYAALNYEPSLVNQEFAREKPKVKRAVRYGR